MPVPTPFHPRTSALCTSLFWKDWAGFHAVRSYDTTFDREYYAIRHACGVIDESPLFKYDVTGPDAGTLLARVMVKDVRTLKPGRVTYLCWCDDDGKVLDDGTVSRFDENHYRVTAAEPTLAWLEKHARGLNVTLTDVSDTIGTLAVQGPTSRDVLKKCSDANLDALRYFGFTKTKLDGVDVVISRTGYTGDLGYEVWVDAANAVKVYDALLDAGRDYRLLPVGLDAMDVCRIEAGYIMNGVDYFSANHCVIESRKSTPSEIGLGWAVQLDRAPFTGQAALRREKARGPEWQTVGLVYDWNEFEELFSHRGLPPQLPSGAWRSAIPVYSAQGFQVGYATSGSWSPTLKENLAIATIRTPHAGHGSTLNIEVTVEFERRRVSARVASLPFFDPARKRA